MIALAEADSDTAWGKRQENTCSETRDWNDHMFNDKRLRIITGHYGAGKPSLVNYAFEKQARRLQ